MEINDLELLNVATTKGGGGSQHTLVGITSSEGIQGWGEGYLDWRTTELPDRQHALLAILAGRSIFDITETINDVSIGDFDAPLRFALETALWDLLGRSLGQPVCNLWGGLYRPQVPLAMCLDTRAVLDNSSAVGELIEHGCRHLVLVCSGELQQDLDAVQLVLIAAGPLVTLQLDAGCRYAPDAILRLSGELPDQSVASVLDPIAGNDLATVCSLAQIMQIPVCLRRNLTSPTDVMALIRTGGVHGVSLDPACLGGIRNTRRAIAVATAGSLATSLYMRPSLGVASAILLHLAGSEIELDHPHVFDSVDADVRTPVQGIRITEGMANVPHSPGLGVSVHRETQNFA